MSRRNPLAFYLDKSNPKIWKAFAGLFSSVLKDAREAGLSEQLIELISLRVSQINGCAFCLDTHTKDAIKAGVSPQRLGALAAWWDAEAIFDEQERAALQLAEAVTRIDDVDSTKAAQIMSYGKLTDEQYSAVQWLAVAMNSTNRISTLSHHPVRANKETVESIE